MQGPTERLFKGCVLGGFQVTVGMRVTDDGDELIELVHPAAVRTGIGVVASSHPNDLMLGRDDETLPDVRQDVDSTRTASHLSIPSTEGCRQSRGVGKWPYLTNDGCSEEIKAGARRDYG